MMYGPRVKSSYQSTTTYHHPDLLRTMLTAMGETSGFPAAADTAIPMSDMFAIPTVISVQSPANNAIVTSPMHVAASAGGAQPIVAMQVYVDHVLAKTVQGSSIVADLSVNPGAHLVVVQSWDSTGAYFKQPVNVTVVAQTQPAISVQSPIDNSTIGSLMQVTASATGPNPIVALQVYVDNTLKTTVQSSSINVSVPMTAGLHYVVLQSWDSKGNYFKQPLSVIVATQLGITIASPTAGQMLAGQVHVVASAVSANPIVATRIYVDNVSVYSTNAASVDAYLNLSPGSHYLVVQNWDSTGKVTKAAEPIIVQ